jgi:hypothetical protein
VRPSIYQAVVASLWSLAAVQSAESYYMCMTKTWGEYDAGGCHNHNLTLATSEKPSVSPTAALTVRPSIYQAVVASLWSLAAVEVAETLYICITKTWCEYEAGGVPQSYPNTNTPTPYKWEAKCFSYCCTDCETQHISGRDCIFFTTGRSRRCWNTLYMYMTKTWGEYDKEEGGVLQS